MGQLTMMGVGPSGAGGPAWPKGSDGPLVLNADNILLNPGDVKDYSSITTSNFSSISISGGVGWVIIGCSGNFSDDGTLLIEGTSCDAITSQVISKVAPDGTVLSYTFVVSDGGNGGDNGDASASGGVGASAVGGGGGGGPGQDGLSDGTGGQGETGEPGGNPGVFPGGAGESAGSAFDGAPGGGGGYLSFGGGCLYMKIAGTISPPASGVTFAFNGQQGGDGGLGGDSVLGYGGGGGGGGPGGCGGKLVLRTKTAYAPTVLLDGGVGGSGGGGGAGALGDGAPADGGQSGNNGVSDIATY